MTAGVPLVMALDDPDAGPGAAGGKGASLARLTRAGFRVPPGFVVTTGAYRDFTVRGGRALPAPVAAAIAGAYASLGDDVPVAVRSSATTEDLPGMSAAGQHDTYLNVRGEAAVLDAVRRCWASLWSARAIDYSARRSVDPGGVSMALVVQRLVPAEAAGVMFTADPLDASRDTVVISANWGLGESVVAGEVTPDLAVIDRVSGTLVSYQLGSKETMTVTDGPGTRVAATPDSLRSAPVLSPGQTGELARVGLAIEELYGEPVDVEWALAAGELSVLRPGRSRLPPPGAPSPASGRASCGTTAWPGTTCGATATSVRLSPRS